VGVERAVGQPSIRHQGGDAGPVDALALKPAAGRLDDPPPRRLLVLLAVPHHTLLPEDLASADTHHEIMNII
jgi:hypothetical protein